MTLDFEERRARLVKKHGEATPKPSESKGRRAKPPLVLRLFLSWLAFPTGFMGAILTSIFLEEDFTPEAVYYAEVALFAVSVYAFLILGGIVSLFRRRFSRLRHTVFWMLLGYAAGSILLKIKDLPVS